MDPAPASEKASTGIVGLDDVLAGGFTRGCFFLLEGMPGTGKTTIALRFLLQGARANEPTLYITLSETREELLNGGLSRLERSGQRRDLRATTPGNSP